MQPVIPPPSTGSTDPLPTNLAANPFQHVSKDDFSQMMDTNLPFEKLKETCPDIYQTIIDGILKGMIEKMQKSAKKLREILREK